MTLGEAADSHHAYGSALPGGSQTNKRVMFSFLLHIGSGKLYLDAHQDILLLLSYTLSTERKSMSKRPAAPTNA